MLTGLQYNMTPILYRFLTRRGVIKELKWRLNIERDLWNYVNSVYDAWFPKQLLAFMIEPRQLVLWTIKEEGK